MDDPRNLDAILEVNFLNQTSLHLASQYPAMVQFLLEKYHTVFDLNARDVWGVTPLMYAAARGYSESAVLLIAHGADVFARAPSTNHSICLHSTWDFVDYAIHSNHWQLLTVCLEEIRARYDTAFHQSMLRRVIIGCFGIRPEDGPLYTNSQTFKIQLIRQYHDINATFAKNCRTHRLDARGKWGTLMHFATCLEEAESLVKTGFTSFNDENDTGLLPVVELSHDIDLVRFCLCHGTDVNYVNEAGQALILTLLSLLNDWKCDEEGRNRTRTLRLLLSKGADPFRADSCKCPCEPSGCSSGSVFGLDYSEFAPLSNVIALFEWLSLISEFYGQQKATMILLTVIRRLKFDELDMTHVCCHSGRGKKPLCKKGKITEENRDEILEEEDEFVQLLNKDMETLSSKSFVELQRIYIRLLQARYQRQHIPFFRGIDWSEKALRTSEVSHSSCPPQGCYWRRRSLVEDYV